MLMRSVILLLTLGSVQSNGVNHRVVEQVPTVESRKVGEATKTPTDNPEELRIPYPQQTTVKREQAYAPVPIATTQTEEDWTGIIVLNTVNFLLSVCCIVLNIILTYIMHGKRAARGFVQDLYLQNSIADYFLGLGVLSQSPVLYLMISRGSEVSGLTVPVYIIYFVTALAVRMSVFMNCVLGVVRCLNIIQPFYLIKKRVITVCTLLYMEVCLVIVGVDLWQFSEKVGIEDQVFLVKSLIIKGLPGFGLSLLTMEKEQYGPSYFGYHLGNLFQFILPTAVPTLFCFVLMIVQLCHLSRKRTGGVLTQENGVKQLKREISMLPKASLTIFLLTCIYVSTSAVSIVTWLVVDGRGGYLGSKSNYESLIEKKRTATPWGDLTAIYFSLSTCALICSTLTPLTLLVRGTGPAFNSVRQMFFRLSSSRETNE